jgi:hypothetical protein
MKLKHNISNDDEQLPKVLQELRKEAYGFRAPDGYFDSLSPRIVDRIKKQEHSSFSEVLVYSFRRPRVWAPVMATMLVALLLIFVVPAKKASTVPATDEWTELNMAYDASYAEEAILAESHTIDKELENKDINYSEPVSLNGKNGPTAEEIAKYLKEHEFDADLLNEY